MTSKNSTRRWTRLLATLLGLAMIAAACGDDDGGDAAPDDADTGSETETDSGSEPVDEGEPQPGGKIIYGLEADTATPWTPAKSVCAVSCHMVMRSVFDTLTLYGEDREVHMNLAESIEPNDDLTQWTITPKSGIQFHDGTPFDAAAIKFNIDEHLASFLTARALIAVEGTELSADGSAVVVNMKEPWAHFPNYLTGQVGYMASPQWLTAAKGDVALESQPVGTGPFVFQSYETGGSFIATKNESYWRADEGLPYLDEIEYRVLADVQSRKNALLSGNIDMMHTSNGDTIVELRDADVELDENTAFAETNYTLMMVDNPESHINDVRVRRALAMAIDNQVVIERRGGGVGQQANGPFSPDQIGHLDDTGFPEFDLEGARELLEEYKAEKGIDSVPVSYTTTSDPFNLGTGELYKQFWEQAGFTVELAQIEQSQFIITALLGNFEMFGWRNHGGIHPDSQRFWWHSEAAQPVGELALNFGRIKDDVIDENLNALRGTEDEDEVREAAENINRQFGEQVYNLWSSWTVWGIAKDPAVNGIDSFVLPDGTPEIEGNGIGGTHQVSQLWLDQ